jgi:acetoin utilization deacetylase AcuC-like enzyme
VAILDVDYHHGNGTQDIFYQRNDVLFTSIHGDPQDEFPFFLGYADETGEGAGEASTSTTRCPPAALGGLERGAGSGLPTHRRATAPTCW